MNMLNLSQRVITQRVRERMNDRRLLINNIADDDGCAGKVSIFGGRNGRIVDHTSLWPSTAKATEKNDLPPACHFFKAFPFVLSPCEVYNVNYTVDTTASLKS